MPSETRQYARQQQRDRAVLREAELRDQAAARQRRPYYPRPIHALTPDQEGQYPNLAAVRQQGREPRCDPGSYRTTLKRLQALQGQYGRLTFISLYLPGHAAQLLQEDAGRRRVMSAAKMRVNTFLTIRGRRVTSSVAVVEHGLDQGMHLHLVVPHAQLSGTLQQATRTAPCWTGKRDGSGCLLPQGGHAVLVGESARDLERLARYLAKYPDARARLKPADPDHLTLKDELAGHMLDGLVPPRTKLCWSTTRRKPTATRGAARHDTVLISTSSQV